MVINKTISLHLESDAAIQIEHYTDSENVSIRINNFIKDEEKSTLGNLVYKENDVIEIYPDVDEVKNIIRALQQILPEDNADE